MKTITTKAANLLVEREGVKKTNLTSVKCLMEKYGKNKFYYVMLFDTENKTYYNVCWENDIKNSYIIKYDNYNNSVNELVNWIKMYE